jgi:hypothetical protein
LTGRLCASRDLGPGEHRPRPPAIGQETSNQDSERPSLIIPMAAMAVHGSTPCGATWDPSYLTPGRDLRPRRASTRWPPRPQARGRVRALGDAYRAGSR